ncbi:unnamed protein product [Brugia pahangi]|uniref:Secreted protein n=1 Tax=Brugia pahangi TaxID=6280 RepID=A0A0N4TLE7_BRUPA|nr:unnamed protein product [Brugia pahangi]
MNELPASELPVWLVGWMVVVTGDGGAADNGSFGGTCWVNLKCIQEISLEFLAQINFCNIVWLWPRMNECYVHLSVRLSVLYVAYIDGIVGLDERQTDR